LALDIIFGTELKASHTANDLPDKLVSAQRFPPEEVGFGWAVESTCHPGVVV
jgi:hypothetical protein